MPYMCRSIWCKWNINIAFAAKSDMLRGPTIVEAECKQAHGGLSELTGLLDGVK